MQIAIHVRADEMPRIRKMSFGASANLPPTFQGFLLAQIFVMSYDHA